MIKFSEIFESNFLKTYNKEHHDLKNLDSRLQSHYDFNDKNTLSIQKYTGDHARHINHILWEKHKDNNYSTFSNNTDYDYGKDIQNIDHNLSSFKTPHKLSLYSGTKRYDPRERMNDKGILYHPAYLSTSINKRMALNFGHKKTEWHNSGDKNEFGIFHHHILKIHVPKDHPGAYIDHISRNKGEYEFLLPRGLNLKYRGTVPYRFTAKERNPVLSALNDPQVYHVNEHHMDIV